MFAGKTDDWDEFVSKLEAKLVAGNMSVANMVEYAETRLTEAQLGAEDYAQDCDFEGAGEERVRDARQNLYNLMLFFVCCSEASRRRPQRRTFYVWRPPRNR